MRGALAAGWLLGLLLAPATLGAQVLFDDRLVGWTTTGNVPGQSVSGGSETTASGNDRYLVRHQHRPGDPFAPNVASTSLSPDERAAVQLSDGIVFTVDLEFEVDLGSNPQLTPELSWSPILEQGGGSMQVPSRSR